MTSDPDLRRDATRFLPRTEEAVDPLGPADVTVDRRGSFAREKFLWLEQVRADPELTPLAFMLAYVLGDLVNERQGFAWPSVARLAAECHVTERGVQKVIRRLVERQHLAVELGNGRGETNRYRWIVRNDSGAHGIENRRKERQGELGDANDQPAPGPSDCKGRTAVHPFEPERVNHGSEKGEQRFQKGRTPVHPTLFKESTYDPLYRLSQERSARSPPIGFDDFWRAYPKRVGRADAMRAFAAAMQQATPDEIIRGAIRYAADRRGEDSRYTKNPATWLSKACWIDPPPSVRAYPRDGLRQSTPFDRSIVAQLHDEGEIAEILACLQQERNKRG
jgi:Helix-turn-helix domain